MPLQPRHLMLPFYSERNYDESRVRTDKLSLGFTAELLLDLSDFVLISIFATAFHENTIDSTFSCAILVLGPPHKPLHRTSQVKYNT
jgi:hypothetical protein